MNPGALDRRLTVEARTVSRDAAGGRSESWATAFKAWAQELRMVPSESVLSDAERNLDKRQFLIRYRDGIGAATHRINYGGQYFDITGVTNRGRKSGLVLDCVATDSLTH